MTCTFVATSPVSPVLPSRLRGDRRDRRERQPVDDTDDAIVTLTPTPVIQIVKTVAPGQRPAPGGNFTFTLVITNPGPTDLTLTTLVDTIYGDLFDSAYPDVTNNN